jgi:hypothetical protein
MPLDPPKQSTPLPRQADCGVNEIAKRISGLRHRRKQIVAERVEAEERFAAVAVKADATLRAATKSLEEEFKAEVETRSSDFAIRQKRTREKLQRRTSMLERSYAKEREAIQGSMQKDVTALRTELEAKKRALAAEQQKQYVPAADRQTRFGETTEGLKTRATRLREQIDALADRHQLILPPIEKIEPIEVTDDGIEDAAGKLDAHLAELETGVDRFSRGTWTLMARDSYIVFAYILAILLNVSLLFLALNFGAATVAFAVGVPALVGTIVGVHFASVAAKKKAARTALALHDGLSKAASHLEQLTAEGKTRLDPDRYIDERIAQSLEVEATANEIIDARRAEGKKAMAILDRRRERATARHIATLANSPEMKADAAPPDPKQLLQDSYQSRIAEAQMAARTTEGDAKRHQDETIQRLEREWREELDAFTDFSAGALASCRSRHPAWTDPAWLTWQPEAAYPSEFIIGTSRWDPQSLAAPESSWPPLNDRTPVQLPTALSVPTCGSLFIRARNQNRSAGLDILHNAVLRAITAFPPQRVKLTMVDPVGLGESFSGLMGLADYDESLVDGRIWTEGVHIEKRLSDLTVHIEKIIQKYLRNLYATIEEFNRQAGEMKEAYRFLVIADFPTGMSELAMERLAAIVSSGPRCGVYTFLLCDGSQAMPSLLDAAQMRNLGLIVHDDNGAFVAEREGVSLGSFAGEVPPAPELTAQLVEQIGRGAQEADRVEVPFTSIEPGDEEMWTLTSDSGVRIPIGKSGADKLRHLDLGKGTAQHALVGGRTGSGKSNLFHVITTSTALWYHPDQIEFYLIDFKKGVEFKAFADGRLPHARVIAIESDREFGLSVLQRIDRELSRRGELFRRYGVQDLAGYRKKADAEHLPRSLLVIDEFQEFFTEDDAVARDAALLLDRFVRQGRAFGIHIILGSQTLSGIYTLAKSTLGQIGVRIALQCNEADSHLIFGEDNAAARLLTRPGEAIYNDMSGLVEGNDPFQVVFLPDEEEASRLVRIAERAASDQWRTGTPTVVFEGNAPAELENNPLLTPLLDRPYDAADRSLTTWLGEANAIKGPTEARFV